MSSVSQKLYNEGSCTSFDSQEILSSSNDRSSIGSIPWTEDAIKQNQEEWEHIERMFYDEEELPQEVNLSNEILEWRRAFPHLRINGTKFNSSLEESSLENFEEISVSHPQSNMSNMKTNITFEQGGSREKMSKDAIIKELEKNLRVNSVPIKSKNRVLVKGFKEDIKVQEESKCNNLRTPSQRVLYPLFKNLNKEISSSATILRMPPIRNVIAPPKNYFTHLQINSSTEKSATMLPNIGLFEISSRKNFRSTSAAGSHRTLPGHSLFQNTLK